MRSILLFIIPLAATLSNAFQIPDENRDGGVYEYNFDTKVHTRVSAVPYVDTNDTSSEAPLILRRSAKFSALAERDVTKSLCEGSSGPAADLEAAKAKLIARCENSADNWLPPRTAKYSTAGEMTIYLCNYQKQFLWWNGWQSCTRNLVDRVVTDVTSRCGPKNGRVNAGWVVYQSDLGAGIAVGPDPACEL